MTKEKDGNINDLDNIMKNFRSTAGMNYEQVIGFLWETKPKGFPLKMHGIYNNAAKGFAANGHWTALEDEGKIRDIDLGFLLGFRAVLHRLNYLDHKLNELERKIDKMTTTGVPGL